MELLESLRDRTSGRVVVVGLRTPYDAARLPWADTYLCADSSVPVAMRALAETLFGLNEARGRLPVRLA